MNIKIKAYLPKELNNKVIFTKSTFFVTNNTKTLEKMQQTCRKDQSISKGLRQENDTAFMGKLLLKAYLSISNTVLIRTIPHGLQHSQAHLRSSSVTTFLCRPLDFFNDRPEIVSHRGISRTSEMPNLLIQRVQKQLHSEYFG